MSLGTLIKSKRVELGLTQSRLAQLAGITQGSLSLIERGNTKSLTGATLLGLSSALKLDPKALAATDAEAQSSNDGEVIAMLMSELSPKALALLRAVAEAIHAQDRLPPVAKPKAVGHS